jgi:ParB/RepB/Spo0J family partition protein
MGDIIKFTGGTAMQCQKLKTYMETGRVVFLPAGRIRPNPSQPRKVFREEDLLELSESIRQHGVIQPLSVRRIGNSYELIAGERRLRSAKLAGLSEIPCIVMTMDEKESAMAAMVENLQRQDLDFIEEAEGIACLMDRWSMSQDQAAKLIGKSQSAVANKLRLLRHSPQVLQALREAGKLPTTLEEHEPFAAVKNYGDSAIEYVVQVWCAGDDYWTTQFELNKNIKVCFDAKGIQMTYPHLNVHIEK